METLVPLVFATAILLFACRLMSRMTGIRLSPLRLGRWMRRVGRWMWGKKPPRGRVRPAPRERHYGGGG